MRGENTKQSSMMLMSPETRVPATHPLRATIFTKNRDRLVVSDAAGEFFRAVVAQARAAGLMSREHFSVDGTLIEAWASLKSFKKKDASNKNEPPPDDPGNPSVDFHGVKRQALKIRRVESSCQIDESHSFSANDRVPWCASIIGDTASAECTARGTSARRLRFRYTLFDVVAPTQPRSSQVQGRPQSAIGDLVLARGRSLLHGIHLQGSARSNLRSPSGGVGSRMANVVTPGDRSLLLVRDQAGRDGLSAGGAGLAWPPACWRSPVRDRSGVAHLPGVRLLGELKRSRERLPVHPLAVVSWPGAGVGLSV